MASSSSGGIGFSGGHVGRVWGRGHRQGPAHQILVKGALLEGGFRINQRKFRFSRVRSKPREPRHMFVWRGGCE